jgi:hypothetical protein
MLGYVSSDHKTITDWHGREVLAHVHEYRRLYRTPTSAFSDGVYYVRASNAEGAWWGRGGGAGMAIILHKSKATSGRARTRRRRSRRA